LRPSDSRRQAVHDAGVTEAWYEPGMKAVLCTRFCSPDDLELSDIDEPQAGPGEAVVRVKSAALNFFDTLIIAGKYQHKPPFPFSPAAEFAGVVESIGAGVTGIALGDRVMGNIGWGAAREAVAVPAQHLVKMPDGLDFDRAAGLTVTYGTTLYALQERADLKSGETLVVLGASGGTGLAAVEIGKIMGARVIACASSDDKLAFARQHGADATICAVRSRNSAASTASTWSTIRSAVLMRSRRYVRWPGKAVIWWSVLPPAKSPSCRSISCS
jgi:NADPH:quinone reductase-like Zn-dependent oxidoreductase